MPSALTPTPVVLLIGASAGIGAALARTFAREGYTLALLARRVEALNELADEIQRQHGAGRARVYAHDVTQSAEVPTLFQTFCVRWAG
jgi:short-subunit dehydrogenase